MGEEEAAQDEEQQKKELECLGEMADAGNGNIAEKFNPAVEQIRKAAIESAQSIYQGDDAKWLEGNDKIPAYLTKYLEQTAKNAEEFRKSSIRDL